MAPAATRAVVSRAEARSRMSRASSRSYLSKPVRSAWPGRGRVTERLRAGRRASGVIGAGISFARRSALDARRSRIHDLLPVLPVAVLDEHRDGRAQSLT